MVMIIVIIIIVTSLILHLVYLLIVSEMVLILWFCWKTFICFLKTYDDICNCITHNLFQMRLSLFSWLKQDTNLYKIPKDYRCCFKCCFCKWWAASANHFAFSFFIPFLIDTLEFSLVDVNFSNCFHFMDIRRC